MARLGGDCESRGTGRGVSARTNGWPAAAASVVSLVAVVAAILGATSGIAVGAEPSEGGGAREQSVAVIGGMVALTLSADAELQTRWGPVVGVGAGEQRGPAVNAYAGYTVPLGGHWSLRPGFRFTRSWQTVEACPARCTFDADVAELAIRYRGASGFIFEFGLPLFGWFPVGPEVGQTQPQLRFYTLATSETAFFSTVLLGFSFGS